MAVSRENDTSHSQRLRRGPKSVPLPSTAAAAMNFFWGPKERSRAEIDSRRRRRRGTVRNRFSTGMQYRANFRDDPHRFFIVTLLK